MKFMNIKYFYNETNLIIKLFHNEINEKNYISKHLIQRKQFVQELNVVTCYWKIVNIKS